LGAKMVEEVLGVQAKLRIPLSNNTVKVRIDNMLYDIEEQLLGESKKFTLFCFTLRRKYRR
jgi:hypothetical protein